VSKKLFYTIQDRRATCKCVRHTQAEALALLPRKVDNRLQYGAINSYKLIVLTAGALKMIITGEESFRDSVGGPIIIAKLAGESARRGFEALLSFTAFISLNLAFFNMLPFPVLDGGHLVMLLIEGVMRKPIPVKATLMVQKIGMAFLLALMIFILFNDISRWNQ